MADLDIEPDYLDADVSMETSLDLEKEWVVTRYEPHTRFLFERARLMKDLLGEDAPEMDFTEYEDGSAELKVEKGDGNMIDYIVAMFSVVTIESVSQTDLETYAQLYLSQINQILGVLGQACDMIYRVALDKRVIQLDATADNVIFTIMESAGGGEVETDLDVRMIDYDLMFKYGEATQFISDLLSNTTGSNASLAEMAKIVGLLFHRSVRNVAAEQYNDFLLRHSYDRSFYPSVLPPIPVSFSTDPVSEEAAYGIESLLAKISGRFDVEFSETNDTSKMIKGFKLYMGLADIEGTMSVARRADVYDKWPQDKDISLIDDIQAFFHEKTISSFPSDFVVFKAYARSVSIVDEVLKAVEELGAKSPSKEVLLAAVRSFIVDRIQTTEKNGYERRVQIAKNMDVTPQYLSDLEVKLAGARESYLYVIPEEFEIVRLRVLDALENVGSKVFEVNTTIARVDTKYTTRVLETAQKVTDLFLAVDALVYIEEASLSERVKHIEDFIGIRRAKVTDMIRGMGVDEEQYMSYIAREALALASTIHKTRTVVNSAMVAKVKEWLKEYPADNQEIHMTVKRLVDAFEHGQKHGLMIAQVLQEWYRNEMASGNHRALFSLRMIGGPILTNNTPSNGPTWDSLLPLDKVNDIVKHIVEGVSTYDPKTATRLRIMPGTVQMRLENLRATYKMEINAHQRKFFRSDVLDAVQNELNDRSASVPPSLAEKFASSKMFQLKVPYLLEWLSASGPAPPSVRGGIIDTSKKVDHKTLIGLRRILHPLQDLADSETNYGLMAASLILNQFRQATGGLALRLEHVRTVILRRRYENLLPDEQAEIDEAMQLFNEENGTEYTDLSTALNDLGRHKNSSLQYPFRKAVLDLFPKINARLVKKVGLWGLYEEIDHLIDWKEEDHQRRWPDQAPFSEELTAEQALVWTQFLIRAPGVTAPEGAKPLIDIMRWAQELGETVTPPRSTVLDMLNQSNIPDRYGLSVLVGETEAVTTDEKTMDRIADSIYYDEKTKEEDNASGRVTINDQRSDPAKIVRLSKLTLLGPASKLPPQYLEGDGVQFYAKTKTSKEAVLIGGTGKYKPDGPSAIFQPALLGPEYTIYLVAGGQQVRGIKPKTKPEVPSPKKPSDVEMVPTPQKPPVVEKTPTPEKPKPEPKPQPQASTPPTQSAPSSEPAPKAVPEKNIFEELVSLPQEDFYKKILKDLNLTRIKIGGVDFINYLIDNAETSISRLNKLRLVVKAMRVVKLSIAEDGSPPSPLARILAMTKKASLAVESTTDAKAKQHLENIAKLKSDIVYRYMDTPETRDEMKKLAEEWNSVDLTDAFNRNVFNEMMEALCKKKGRTRDNMAMILRGIAEKNGLETIKTYF